MGQQGRDSPSLRCHPGAPRMTFPSWLPLDKLVAWILDHLPAVFRTWVSSRLTRPRTGFIICALFLGFLLFALLREYIPRNASYERLIARLVGQATESTPQSHKGLEALLNSLEEENGKGILSDSEYLRSLRTKLPSQDLQAAIQSIANTLDALAKAPPSSAPVMLEVSNSDKKNPVLTDAPQETGFLFVPGTIVRSEPLHSQLMAPPSPTLPIEDSLRTDVLMARAVRHILQDLLDVQVANDGTKPHQVYFITRNGVNEIHDTRAPGTSARDVYASQFRATTFFPSRPYFWPAIETEDERANQWRSLPQCQNYFHITKPYVDIGGHGLVITLAKAFAIAGLPDACVCLDIVLENASALGAKLTRAIQELGGECQLQTWQFTFTNNKVSGLEPSDKDPVLYKEQIQRFASRNGLSDVLGNIFSVDLSDSPEAATPEGRRRDGPVIGVVPLLRDNKAVKILVFGIDLGRFVEVTAYWGMASLGSGLAIILTLIGMWISTNRERLATQRAFEGVDEVLWRSTTPFVKLDNQDRIVLWNPAFCELLGLPLDSELGTRRFRDLLHEGSREQYDKIQAQRKSSADPGPQVKDYQVRILSTPHPKDVFVVSAIASENDFGTLPETFGVLLTRGEFEHFRLVVRPQRRIGG